MVERESGEFDVAIRLPSGGGTPTINYSQAVAPGTVGEGR